MKRIFLYGIGLLIFLSGVLVIGAQMASRYFYPSIPEDVLAQETLPDSVPVMADMTGADDPESFEAYAEIFQRQNIFEMPVKSPAGPVDEIPGIESGQDFRQRYEVVGILVDQDPRAVFQDKETGETFFLSIGGKLDDGIVEAIFPEKVILRRNAMRVEMNL